MAHDLRPRDAEEHPGLRAGDAGQKTFPPHAGIDDHGHGAEFEEGEGGGDQRQALADQHEDAVAALDALALEPRAPGLDLGLEFGEGKYQVVNGAGGGAAARNFHRRMIRLARRHQRQVAGDVGGRGHEQRVRVDGGLASLRAAVRRDADPPNRSYFSSSTPARP